MVFQEEVLFWHSPIHFSYGTNSYWTKSVKIGLVGHNEVALLLYTALACS